MWTAILIWMAICAAFVSGFLLAAMFGARKQADRAAEYASCEHRLVYTVTANDSASGKVGCTECSSESTKHNGVEFTL